MVVAADEPLWPGVAGLIRSANSSTSSPEALRFFLVTLPEELGAARRAMECYGVAELVVLVPFAPATLASRVRVVADPKVTGHLASPLNFARFYLPQLLPPTVRRVLYLDADVVVQGDLRELFAAPLPPRVPLAAVPRADAHFRYARYVKKCDGVYASRYGGARLNASAPTFNAGVALVDLRAWAQLALTREAEWWMARHADAPDGLWALGSQPIMHLMLHGRWAPLPPRWNLDGLGRVPALRAEALARARLLHWTGRRKPWLRDGLYARLFARHVPAADVRRCARA